MPQAPNRSTRAVDSLSDSNEQTLGEDQRIEETPTGVWLYSTTASGAETSRRVDSEGDLDHIANGNSVWWKKLVAQQAAREAAAANTGTRKEPAKEPAKGKAKGASSE